jgi:hypothetical protein
VVAVSDRVRGLTPLGARAVPTAAFLGLLALAPALLGLARLLPAEDPGLALRLASASACVLLLPGALVVRALGRPAGIGVALAGALAWSLSALFAALALTFAVGGSLRLTLVLLGAVAAAALVPALLRAPVSIVREDGLAALAVLLAGAVFAGAVWWAANTIHFGDALFHLGRTQKLAAFDELGSIDSVNEFRDGGAHPGYAVPLWHAAVALVARLAGVEPETALLHLPAVLTPLALVLAYAAGAALFRSWGGGIATAAAQAALLGFSRFGTGSFESLALPATASRLLLVPALLALVFSLAAGGRRSTLLPSIAAASLALAVAHPTYAIFIAVPLGGFLLARLALAFRERAEIGRIAAALAALLAPAGLYALWLRPIAEETVSQDPEPAERAREIAHYAGQVDVVGDSFRLAPELISRGGAVAVAGLLSVPLAVLAARRRWAAYVLGGSLLVLVVALVPAAFSSLADTVSLSQARRIAQFLPLPFALAGAATILGRLKLAGCLAAAAGAIAVRVLYPGEFLPVLVEGGPGWAVWFCLAGAAAALVVGTIARRSAVRSSTAAWAAAVALSFATPIAVAGFADLRRNDQDPYALSSGLVQALRDDVSHRQVVFSDLETSYRIAGYVPVYVAAAPPSHVADTPANHARERRRDVLKFFSRGALSIPRRYGASWIVVAKDRYDRRLDLPRAYEDERFVVYRLATPRRS